jgi:hypothetical protein
MDFSLAAVRPLNNPFTTVLAPPPYLARVETLKSSAAQNADAEIRASRLANQIKDLVREVKMRDQGLQEAGVKIELLEKKVDTVRKQVGVDLGRAGRYRATSETSNHYRTG